MISVMGHRNVDHHILQGMIFLCSSMGLFINRSFMNFYKISVQLDDKITQPPFNLPRVEQVKQLHRCLAHRNKKLFPIQIHGMIKNSMIEDAMGNVDFPELSYIGHTLHVAERIGKHRIFKYTKTENGNIIRAPVKEIVFAGDPGVKSFIPNWVSKKIVSQGWVILQDPRDTNGHDVFRSVEIIGELNEWTRLIIHHPKEVPLNIQSIYSSLLKNGNYIVLHNITSLVSNYLGCSVTSLKAAISLKKGTFGVTPSIDIEKLQQHGVIEGETNLKEVFPIRQPRCHLIDSILGEYGDYHWAKLALLTHTLLTFNVYGKDPWCVQWLEINRPGFLILVPHHKMKQLCFIGALVFRNTNSPSEIRLCYLDMNGSTHGSFKIFEDD